MFRFAMCIGVVVATASSASAQFEQSGGGGGFAPSTNEKAAGFFKSDEEFFKVQSQGQRKYTTQQCAPPNPTQGPKDIYVYQNNRGNWKLPPVAQLTNPMTGSAKYSWFDGSKHEDKLTYIAHGHVTDQGGYLIPQGTKVSVWAFMATDNAGNSMFYYLGTDAVINAPQGRRYPMYYSWSPPGPNTKVIRFVTSNGTKRL